MLEQVATFVEAVEKFALENKIKMTFVLKMILKSHDKLKMYLDKLWNSEGGRVGAVDAAQACATETGAAEASAVAAVLEAEKNPTGVEESYTFKLATPLKEKPSFSCQEQGCSYTVSNYRVFKDHMKKKHQMGVSVEVPKVQCLLPHQRGTRVNTRHPMDYICTHLKKVTFIYFGPRTILKSITFLGS